MPERRYTGHNHPYGDRGGLQRLPDADRAAAAAGCRDRAAARASGPAARQIADVDVQMLVRRLDVDVAVAVAEAAAFERACAAALPLVTPGLRVRFAGVTGNGITFTYPTQSDRPLTIRGTVTPAPASGRVVARREVAPHGRLTAPIDADGRFEFRDLELRKTADNTFLLSIEAPPDAQRLVRFTAPCMDCLISGSPPPDM